MKRRWRVSSRRRKGVIEFPEREKSPERSTDGKGEEFDQETKKAHRKKVSRTQTDNQAQKPKKKKVKAKGGTANKPVREVKKRKRVAAKD